MKKFMEMKKMFFVGFLLTLSMMLSAQTQHGMVKTRGRMVNGQHVKVLDCLALRCRCRAEVRCSVSRTECSRFP